VVDAPRDTARHAAGAGHMVPLTPDAKVAALATYTNAYSAAILADGNIIRAYEDARALGITDDTLAEIRAVIDAAKGTS
jgi:hypothetical protein